MRNSYGSSVGGGCCSTELVGISVPILRVDFAADTFCCASDKTGSLGAVPKDTSDRIGIWGFSCLVFFGLESADLPPSTDRACKSCARDAWSGVGGIRLSVKKAADCFGGVGFGDVRLGDVPDISIRVPSA